MDIDEYLIQRVDDQIKWYSDKSSKCQKMYKRYQVIEIIIASCIPFFAGYSTKALWVPIVIGVCGVIITVIESITKLYKFHENWIQYRTTSELLKHQKYLYVTNSYPYSGCNETPYNIFVSNIEQIISSENGQWKVTNSKRTCGDESYTTSS